MVLSSARTTTSPRTRIVLLAPAGTQVPEVFHVTKPDRERHNSLLAGMQRLRGGIYLEDGAIDESHLTHDGRHELAVDDQSWHVLLTDGGDQILGCARYRAHEVPVSFNKLGVRKSAMGQCKIWGRPLRAAVEEEISAAKNRDLSYVEVGGWALSQALRFTGEALRIALASFSLGRLLGGCLGITTATRRNNSSSMLRRLGGRSLEIDGKALPHYFDQGYGCEMEILRFDSARPNPRFESLIETLSDELMSAEVFSARPQPVMPRFSGMPISARHSLLSLGDALSHSVAIERTSVLRTRPVQAGSALHSSSAISGMNSASNAPTVAA